MNQQAGTAANVSYVLGHAPTELQRLTAQSQFWARPHSKCCLALEYRVAFGYSTSAVAPAMSHCSSQRWSENPAQCSASIVRQPQ